MIYLAGSCASEQRSLMMKVLAFLRGRGEDVYVPFELKIPNAWDMPQEAWSNKVFENDIAAIDKANIVVLISPGRIGSAGTNWEQGYAYAKGKKVFVFQYTNQATSVMTYSGSTIFVNTNEESIIHELARVFDGELGKGTCSTILT